MSAEGVSPSALRLSGRGPSAHRSTLDARRSPARRTRFRGAPPIRGRATAFPNTSMPDVTCSRCGQTRAGFERPPVGVGGAVGERLVREICQDCWGQWLKQQTMLINHYGLNLMDPQARTFLSKNRDAFLFKTGSGEEVDTTKQGTVTW
jgi:Fe-S cluster biosynthesis and repair protein YggX